MARIAFTPMIAELVGKLAGSVFQYSYGGFQVHSRVVPSNPQTQRQQLRRGWFGWFAASWRSLTAMQQGTFIAAAGTAPEAFRLFVGSNINAFLVGQPTITSYVASAQPDPISLVITDYDFGVLDIQATGAITTVPTGHSCLLFFTAEKPLSRVFTNPSEFSPIAVFPAGTDLSAPVSVLADWQALYGVLIGGLRLCLNSVLINNSNGNRSVDNIVCAPPVPSTTERIMDDAGNFLIDADGVFIVQS